MTSDWFAPRLKELREASGMTQQALADLAGLKLGGVRDLEQGRNKPTWDTVLALAKALGVGCEAFEQPPATDQPPAGRGRPRKAPPAPPPAPSLGTPKDSIADPPKRRPRKKA